jgi:hypothetical protein
MEIGVPELKADYKYDASKHITDVWVISYTNQGFRTKP